MPPTADSDVQRFEVDVRAEAQALGVRAAAAMVAAVAALWLLSVTHSMLLRILAGLGLLFSILWIRAALKRAPASATDPDYVEIGPERLAIRQRGLTHTGPWSIVRQVTFDHDRLAITVEFEGEQAPVSLDTMYRGIGLQDLADRIDAAARTARQGASHQNVGTMGGHE